MKNKLESILSIRHPYHLRPNRFNFKILDKIVSRYSGIAPSFKRIWVKTLNGNLNIIYLTPLILPFHVS